MSIETVWRKAGTRALGFMLGIAVLAGCGGGGGSSAATPSASTSQSGGNVAGASVVRQLEVPDGLAQAPLDSTRELTVPPGFGIRVWARVNKARFLALAPDGDVLVSVPSAGKIVLLRPQENDTPQSFDYATGLQNPQDMVFHRIDNTTYLYVAESNRITRSVYQDGETSRANPEVVIDGLPDASTPELRGAYGHELKNIALTPDHRLFVSIASTCNACEEDTTSDPVRGAIYQYSADGKNGRLFARGLRNAEGLDILPGTDTLWVTVNNRDQIAYPADNDFDGDGSSDLGKVLPQYVNDHPPELFTRVRDGANYGWPFCNALPNESMSNLDVTRDVELNPNGQKLDCSAVDRVDKGIQAHSAPLGFSFLQDSKLPAPYQGGAALALHGCWNCTRLLAGYKVIYFPFDGNGNAGAESDLVTGFVTDPEARRYWGRPVDVIPDGQGRLLISDDYAGAIYQLYPTP